MNKLKWVSTSGFSWKAPINSDSYFEILQDNSEYKLRIESELLPANQFDLPFSTLEEAKEKAEDLYSIFEEMNKE